MGLFDRIKKGIKSNSTPAIEPVEVAEEPDGIYAPVPGRIVPLAEVSDPVFSSGGLGKGCGIEPDAEVVYSPVSGTVSALMENSRHAVGLSGDNGVELLVHVGIDTVSMQGNGFEYFVSEGQHVVAGVPLMKFSAEKIKIAGHQKTVIVVVTNSDELKSVDMVSSEIVKAGDKVIEVSR